MTLQVGEVVERRERPVLAKDVRDHALEAALYLPGKLRPQVWRQLGATPGVQRHEAPKLGVETAEEQLRGRRRSESGGRHGRARPRLGWGVRGR